MRTTDWDQVRQRLLALSEERAGHGDGSAANAPAAPLTEDQVSEAEQQFGIIFPADYRGFLLRVSAGGHFPRELRRGPDGWHWVGDQDTDLTRLGTPFPDHDAALAASDEFWDNPLREADYANPEEFQSALAVWSEAAEAAERDRVTGAVFLKGHGHNFSALLVVSGPQHGEMWFDGRPTCDRLNPLLTDEGRPAGFADWYLDWLNHESGSKRRSEGKGTPIWLRWFDTWGEENCG
ncbi:SMI1/KNR4 family protein [Streptomyces sp. CBMA123]|uniref:SMI1/KNR4 family protein n=1 Tax=Streptomyces sp. CBMA123 TaxID=1896313 RepID=UPI001661BF42|nr:SMI1/KNR4 family protein [Streptomyces sp. CBMA123]MBD0696067.1 hypothetical protein [Streptomyces sp. CBMA123]